MEELAPTRTEEEAISSLIARGVRASTTLGTFARTDRKKIMVVRLGPARTFYATSTHRRTHSPKIRPRMIHRTVVGECTRPHIAITPLACHSSDRRSFDAAQKPTSNASSLALGPNAEHLARGRAHCLHIATRGRAENVRRCMEVAIKDCSGRAALRRKKWDSSHPDNRTAGKEGETDHRRHKHSPRKIRNSGTPVGYSGRISLRREQCGI
jgi:hypothetical protein